MFYLCSENKGADQLICVFVFAYAIKAGFLMTWLILILFVFAYAKCWFSHDAAKIVSSSGQ